MIALALASLLACSDPHEPCGISPTHRVDPRYPLIAAEAGMTAACRAAFDVDGNGRVVNVCTRCATGMNRPVPERLQTIISQRFVQASEAALSQWRYGPDGYGSTGIQTEFTFSLEENGQMSVPEAPALGECLGPQIS